MLNTNLHYRESDGCTYYKRNGDWYWCPTYLDGRPDFEMECSLEDIDLDKEDLQKLTKWLGNKS